MTTVSPLGGLGWIAPLPALSPAGASSGNTLAREAVASSSSSVTLGQAASALGVQTYSPSSVLQAAATPPVWENESNDAVTSLMAGNYSSQSLAGQFQGLGAALLNSFKNGGGDFSQSVLLLPPGTQPGADVSALDGQMQSELHTQATNQVSLDITTASGVKVQLTLGSQADGLAVQVQVSNGTLSASERGALEKLSGAFQDAIDGLTANPPKLDLSGLTQYDSTVLSSVDFHAGVNVAGVGPETVDFHADSQQRTVTATNATGTVNVSVDMSNPAILGGATQQAQAMASYLKQFDQERSRGNGDSSLMAMFEDAFTQMNSNVGTASSSQQSGPISLSDADHSMLTGLADFSASITQNSKPINPLRSWEVDAFSYQVSQQTSVKGSGQLDRSISQAQQSHLSASYDQPLATGTSLDLTTSMMSQNYSYNQIDDDASSRTDIAYSKGLLTKASSSQSAHQSTHVSKYAMGKLVEDTTTPTQASRTQDFLGLLRSAEQNQSKSQLDAYQWQHTLSAIHDGIFLQADPEQLGGN